MADGSEDEWEEESSAHSVVAPCVFCRDTYTSSENLLWHCERDHGVDLRLLYRQKKFDFYSWAKVVNYLRVEHPTPETLLQLVKSPPPFPWSDESFLLPVLEDDPLLQHDMEEEIIEEKEKEEEAETQPTDMCIMQRLRSAENMVLEYKSALARALSELDKMREAVKGIVCEPEISVNGICGNSEEEEEEEEENSYFSSYSHYGIHEEMLKDSVRTEAYQLFIERNSENLFRDKVVLDVGCGTGILSLLAARAGAKLVIAVDRSSIIYKAMDIARENGMDGKIHFVKGCIEDVVLPLDKVDVVISEWMGYCLLYESMMDSVLYARDRWLKDPQHVYPNQVSISIVAIGNNSESRSKLNFWDDVYGFKMTCVKEEVIREAAVETVDEYSLVSSAVVIKKFNLTSLAPDKIDFESSFTLTMLQSGTCDSLVLFFDVQFNVISGYSIHFSTGPQDEPTHWKQTVLNLKDPISICAGDLLKGRIKLCKNRQDHRALDIHLSMKLLSYHSTVTEITTQLEQKFMLS